MKKREKDLHKRHRELVNILETEGAPVISPLSVAWKFPLEENEPFLIPTSELETATDPTALEAAAAHYGCTLSEFTAAVESGELWRKLFPIP